METVLFVVVALYCSVIQHIKVLKYCSNIQTVSPFTYWEVDNNKLFVLLRNYTMRIIPEALGCNRIRTELDINTFLSFFSIQNSFQLRLQLSTPCQRHTSIFLFFKILYLSKLYIQHRAWRHGSKIKSCMLLRLNQPGAPSMSRLEKYCLHIMSL